MFSQRYCITLELMMATLTNKVGWTNIGWSCPRQSYLRNFPRWLFLSIRTFFGVLDDVDDTRWVKLMWSLGPFNLKNVSMTHLDRTTWFIFSKIHEWEHSMVWAHTSTHNKSGLASFLLEHYGGDGGRWALWFRVLQSITTSSTICTLQSDIIWFGATDAEHRKEAH